MADDDNRVPADPVLSTPRLNGHSIRRVGYRNTVTYFLHLPDGNPEGTGYAATGFQSVQRLAAGEVAAMTAVVDGSATYQGWDDLRATMRDIIAGETAALRCDIHMPERDAALNPGDYADHRSSARLIMRGLRGHSRRRPCARPPDVMASLRRLYIGRDYWCLEHAA